MTKQHIPRYISKRNGNKLSKCLYMNTQGGLNEKYLPQAHLFGDKSPQLMELLGKLWTCWCKYIIRGGLHQFIPFTTSCFPFCF